MKKFSNVIPIGLPHTPESEQVIIGTILATPSCLNYSKDRIDANHFFNPTNKIIINAINDLILQNVPPEIIMVYNRLKEKGDNLKIGDLEGLQSYLQYNSDPHYLDHWIGEVKKFYHLRTVIETCHEIVHKSKTMGDTKVEDFIEYAEEKFSKIAQDKITEGLVPVSQLLFETVKEIENRVKNKDCLSGISSSLEALDKMTFGFQKSDLIVLAARPAMGKTALAINIATHAVFKEKKRVAFFSLEMSNRQLIQRMLAISMHIDSRKFRSGDFKGEEILRIKEEIQKFQTDFLLFDDKPGMSIYEIGSRCRRACREYGNIDMIIVDYMQLMSAGTHKKFQNREREISEISVGLKNLAKEMNCPVLALSQLNRGVESREDKRPRPSDLRESGSIEQDSDQILFIYRDEVYNKESPDKGIAEIIIGKNRHGEIGTAKVAYIAQYTQFTNLAYGLE